MKITGWTSWDSPEYIDFRDKEKGVIKTYADCEPYFNLVADELSANGYKFCGNTHQQEDGCVPVVDDTYKICCSCREWGDIMARAYNIGNGDGMAYVVWAWVPAVAYVDDHISIPEREILPGKSNEK